MSSAAVVIGTLRVKEIYISEAAKPLYLSLSFDVKCVVVFFLPYIQKQDDPDKLCISYPKKITHRIRNKSSLVTK